MNSPAILETPPPDTAAGAMLLGLPASPGIARGYAAVCRCGEASTVPRRTIAESEVPSEMARLDAAIEDCDEELRRLGADARRDHHATEGAIIDTQREMLHDPLLRAEIAKRCRRGNLNVEAALSDAAEHMTHTLEAAQAAEFRERAADIRDVTRRLIGQLQGRATYMDELPEQSIVVVRELLPSLLATMEQRSIRAVVAEQGGATAHAVILARERGLPVVIHVDRAAKVIRAGDRVIVDGISGRVFVRPDPAIEREYEQAEASLSAQRHALQALAEVPAVTRDGIRIRIEANAGKAADAVAAALVGAEGIGLYRTEFAFAVLRSFPTEEEQYQIYRTVANQCPGRKVVFRVLDIGSDKLLPYFPLRPEANPSLGHRGLRLMLSHPGILRTQLRAILRLSADYPAALLFPMIAGLDDFEKARRAIMDAQTELQAEGRAFNSRIQVGAMIEIPSAVLTVRQIAREADFLSIGTNDLVQYLLATDRTSSDMAPYYEPLHPAVIRALQLVLNDAAAAGKPVSVCGEVGGNPAYTQLLLGLGVRSFSIAPSEILEVKRAILDADCARATAMATRVLAADTIEEVKSIIREGLARRDLPIGA